MKSVLVTGGTGKLGSRVVESLIEKDYDVRILSSRSHTSRQKEITYFSGDLALGSGIRKAAAGVDAIIHCATAPLHHEQVDKQGTKNLLQSVAGQSQPPHFIYISIVGIHKSQFPYYQSKLAAEKMIRESGIPYTILRATQFHSYILEMVQSFLKKQLNGTVQIPAGMKFQSVDINEVAGRLCDDLEHPAGLLPDFGGPEVLTFEEMVQEYLDTNYPGIKPVTTNFSSALYDAFSSGVNLCPERKVGKVTWKEFLGG